MAIEASDAHSSEDDNLCWAQIAFSRRQLDHFGVNGKAERLALGYCHHEINFEREAIAEPPREGLGMMTQKRARCLTAILALLIPTATGWAQSLNVAPDQNWSANLDAGSGAYYSEHKDEIRGLQRVIENRESPIEDRKQRFEELTARFKDIALPIAAKLVEDSSTDLALKAVEVLSNALGIGSPGTGSPDRQTEPALSRAAISVERQQLARQALRGALADGRADVRSAARQALIPLSDEAAIRSVKEAAKNGEIPEPEAVRLCAEAPSPLGRACLLNYLAEGSPDGKAAAVRVLGSIPTYLSLVRDKIYLTSAADPKLRAVAAAVLSRFDPSFMTYGLTVTADPKTPPVLVAGALRGYIWSARAQGKYDAAQRAVLMEALKNRLVLMQGSPGAEPLAGLREQLEAE
jgi:hypothetical protein